MSSITQSGIESDKIVLENIQFKKSLTTLVEQAAIANTITFEITEEMFNKTLSCAVVFNADSTCTHTILTQAADFEAVYKTLVLPLIAKVTLNGQLEKYVQSEFDPTSKIVTITGSEIITLSMLKIDSVVENSLSYDETTNKFTTSDGDLFLTNRVLPDNTDLNTIRIAGTYVTTGVCQNSPDPSFNNTWIVEVLAVENDVITQRVTKSGTNEVSQRVFNKIAWGNYVLDLNYRTLPDHTDFNTVTRTGEYRIHGPCPNAPTSDVESNDWLLSVKTLGNYVYQKAMQLASHHHQYFEDHYKYEFVRMHYTDTLLYTAWSQITTDVSMLTTRISEKADAKYVAYIYGNDTHIPVYLVEGTTNLERNKAYTITISEGTTFVLPVGLEHETCTITADISITGAYTIDWGTNLFFGKIAPEIEAGTYSVIWDYSAKEGAWVCGVISKGQE